MATKKEPPVPPAPPAVKAALKAEPLKPVAPSPIPGDTFHERGPAIREGTKTGPLPGNFPGFHQLKVAGFTTYESARTIPDLNKIAGLDAATAKLIEAELEK
jgi:hypothetical protein